MANPSNGMVDPAIFEHLQQKIDEDTGVRDKIREVLQTLEKQGKAAYHKSMVAASITNTL
ncbi:Translin-1 [Elasticomyces elasticus]|nr:Translin-1 [Elasticomyces elasticus]